MDPHRLAELRSIAYHQRVAERLAAHPELRAAALRRLDDWTHSGSLHADYVTAWRRLLAMPDAELARALVVDDDEGRALRQTTPFAGALAPRERWEIHRRVREELEAG